MDVFSVAMPLLLSLFRHISYVQSFRQCTLGTFRCKGEPDLCMYRMCDQGKWQDMSCSGGTICLKDPKELSVLNPCQNKAPGGRHCGNNHGGDDSGDGGGSSNNDGENSTEEVPTTPRSTESTTEEDDKTTTTTPPPTSTVDITTQCPYISTTVMCPCATPNPKYLNLTQEALDTILRELREKLTLDKKTLSSSIRRRRSADDSRVTSQLMGYTGGTVLVTVILVIVLSDVAKLVHHLSVRRRLLSKKVRA